MPDNLGEPPHPDADRYRNSQLEAILANAVDAIVTIDEHGHIDSVNPATERVFGYAAHELLGKNVNVLMPDPYRSQHDGYLATYKSTGMAKIIGVGREVEGRRKDGSTFPVHLAVSEIQVEGRRLFTGIIRDISDVKAIEKQLASMNEELEQRVRERTEQLREAQTELMQNERFATLGKVAGGIAHEIRNPLNAVKTSAYFLLQAKQLPAEKVREHLERIDRQVTMIDNVVTALSDVAKLPKSRLQATDVDGMLRNAVRQISLPEEIDVQWDIAGDLPAAMMDEQQMMIAIMNLVRNARDAMLGDGGTMTITAWAAGEETIEIRVFDTGKGISVEELSRVFEPLYTTKARGMGLGLPITKAIVDKNQGQIRVDSQLGHGTQATITLRRS